MMLPQVRIATPDDDDEIMDLCRALHAENGLFTLNENKIRGYFQQSHARKGAFVGVIGPKGKIEASTCLLITDSYYTDDWHLTELWCHVGEKYRNSRNAEALIEFGKSCSDRIGIPLVIGIISNDRVRQKVRLYRRMLGYPAGAFFVYNGRWAEGVKPSEEDFMSTLEVHSGKFHRERRRA